jgi:hypothetical protein
MTRLIAETAENAGVILGQQRTLLNLERRAGEGVPAGP